MSLEWTTNRYFFSSSKAYWNMFGDVMDLFLGMVIPWFLLNFELWDILWIFCGYFVDMLGGFKKLTVTNMGIFSNQTWDTMGI